MQRRHHLAVGVKGKLSGSRITALRLLLSKLHLLRHIQQCKLCRVSRPVSLLQHCIIAERHPEKEIRRIRKP